MQSLLNVLMLASIVTILASFVVYYSSHETSRRRKKAMDMIGRGFVTLVVGMIVSGIGFFLS